MYLCSLACTVPEMRFRQADLWSAYKESEQAATMRGTTNRLIEKILTNDNGIEFRHFALGPIAGIFPLGAEALNRAFETQAPAVAVRSLRKALALADMRPGNLDALFVCTCTGYLCPGVSSFVAEHIGLSPAAYLQDIVGMGCGAAIPTLRSALGFLAANPRARVGVVAVEICSAAFFLNHAPDVIISACLFGDGAAAAILSGREVPQRWRFSAFDTIHRPEDRESLRFVNHEGKLRNRLDRTVPAKASESVAALWDRHGHPSETVVLPHAGGRDVLRALEEGLGVGGFPESAWVLREGGNMSSPSVLFALAAYLRHADPSTPVSLPAAWSAPPRRPAARNNLWLTSFGAGFSAHSCSVSRTG